MLTLICREVRDHAIYLAGMLFVTAVMILLLILTAYQGLQVAILLPVAVLISGLMLGLCGLGGAQMYTDRAHRISPLLATLAVTRSRILAARILVGVLALLLALVPVLVATTILLRAFLPPPEFYGRMLVEVSLTVLLTGLACYCLGLLVGWSTNAVWRLAGGVLVPALLISFVWIKGAGPDVMVLLLLLIAATLLRIWHSFTSASL